MPTVDYSTLSERAREKKRSYARARRAALQDLAELHPGEFAVLLQGSLREMRR